MFVSSSGIHGDNSTVESARTNEWEAHWAGFIYMEGTPAGKESIERFLREGIGDLPRAAEKLRGIYYLFLLDRVSGTGYAFIDPNGLYHAYRTRSATGTSILELAAANGLGPQDIAPEPLVEFFHYGALYFGDTLFRDIRRMDPEHILRIEPGGEPSGAIQSMTRTLRDLSAPPTRTFEQCLAAFAGSIKGEKVSLDLTGGIDSRLLAVMLRYLGVDFELALSGRPDNEDIAIAEEVASALGVELHLSYHAIDGLEASLPAVFAACDGSFDVLREHRLAQLQEDRKRRGVTLSLSGTGGELYKDFWWLQDFPWYARKQPNIKKLFHTRIAPVEPHHEYLAGPYRQISEQHGRRFCDRLSKYAVRGNTQTYDRIYYEVKMRDYAGRSLSSHLRLLKCCAPFLDRELVAVGYNLPRHIRAFNGFHRQMMTRYAPQVAAIRTTEGGMSVSSSFGHVVSDIPRYAYDKLSRLERKLSQRLLNRTPKSESPNHPELLAAGRDLVASHRAVERLQEFGLLSSTLHVNDLSSNYLGSILSLDLLLDHLAAPQLPTLSPESGSRW
jgi:asparagine synthetase B (glutamine-hydrolysing)